MQFSIVVRRFYFQCLICALSGLLLLGVLSPARAVTPDERKKETLITAKQMKSDPATGIVTALGNVEISHGDYILHADKVTYNQKTGVMRAQGHVAT